MWSLLNHKGVEEEELTTKGTRNTREYVPVDTKNGMQWSGRKINHKGHKDHKGI